MIDVLRIALGGSVVIVIILALYYVPATVVPMALLGFGLLIVAYIIGAAILQMMGINRD